MKENNIDIYNNSKVILERTMSSSIISWITILVLLLVSLVFLSMIPFNVYKNYNALLHIENDISYLNISVDKRDFPINKYNKLYIKRDSYKYQIVTIKDDLVTLKIDIDPSLKIEGNIIPVNIVKKRTTVFKIIKELIKKGFEI